ncbi:hypothetical protein H2O64_04655 [Kordia sp. YSTF-M3]|uniref:Lipoprotein n=1 Tax=Kordia aestuariivivens TaxID=2759037 RepID=A0ABR7Q6I7_9FLAO|nr:hypothetical protein [Kordia aestuariivivens]MBC8753949.1 hypothetical protein [Kordia aestuariivivens]
MKRVRNLIRVLCILTLALTLTNCQNDTVTEIQEEATVQKEFPFKSSVLSKQDVEVNTKLSNQMRSLATLQSSSIAESVYNETYNFTVHTDVANFVESTENNSHSYTFPIERDNNTGSTLENLVFSYNASIDDYTASLVTYHFTASQKQEFVLTKHVATSHEITSEPITVNLSDMLAENTLPLPCTTSYSVYHITPGPNSGTFLYSTNGYEQNSCEHENDDDPCQTFTLIDIYCPDGGSGSGSGTDDNTSTDPYGSPNNTPSGGGNDSGSDTTTPPSTDDDPYNDIVTSPITKEEYLEISSELNDVLGEGNWEFDDNVPDDAPNFESPEELETFLASLVEGNFTLESSQMEPGNNSTRRDVHKMQVSSFPESSIRCEMRVKLPTIDNGLPEMRVLSMNTALEGSTTLMDWTQTNTSETSDEANGPTVENYISGSVNKQRIIVTGKLEFGIKYRGRLLGSRKFLEITISYFTDNSTIDPIWSYWDYL